MKTLKTVFSSVKAYCAKFTFKKGLCALFLLLLVFLPTFLAHLSKNQAQEKSTYFAVSVFEEDGTLIASEEGLIESSARYSLMDSFYKIHTHKKEVSYAPGDPETDPYISATVTLNKTTTDFKCYFSLDGTSDYLVEQSGKIYTVSSLYTKDFLASPYAASFYEAATPPSLITIDNETVLPSKVTSWNYLNNEKKFVSVTNSKIASGLITYENTGKLEFHFSDSPDQCKVEVYDAQQLIYSGDLEALSSLTTSLQNEFNIKITATWKQKESASFFGTVQYDFAAHIRNRTSFSISSDCVFPGGWIFLSATNVTDPSKIQFAADWCSPPVFYQDGTEVHTLIPIPQEPDKDVLQLDISHGASSQTFQITVLPKDESNATVPLDAFLNKELVSSETLQVYRLSVDQTPPASDSSVYFRGNFLSPSDGKFYIGYSHNTAVTTENGETLTLLGTEFCTSEELPQAVAAWNHGVVSASQSSEALGNYIVVDHGCGLQTWYCHLSRSAAEAGDVIQKGQTVGFTGTGGISTQNGFLILCTVQQTVIDPALLMGCEIRT